ATLSTVFQHHLLVHHHARRRTGSHGIGDRPDGGRIVSASVRSGYGSPLQGIDLEVALRADLTSQSRGDGAMLREGRADIQRGKRRFGAVPQADRAQAALDMLQFPDGSLHYPYVPRRERSRLFMREGRGSVGEYGEIRGPVPQEKRKLDPLLPIAQIPSRPVPHLVTMAIRAMQDGDAPACGQTRYVGQDIPDAGGEDQFRGGEGFTRLCPDPEALRVARTFHGVSGQEPYRLITLHLPPGQG